LRMQQAVCRSRIRVASMSAPIRVSGFMHGLYLAPRWIRSAWENFKKSNRSEIPDEIGGSKTKKNKNVPLSVRCRNLKARNSRLLAEINWSRVPGNFSWNEILNFHFRRMKWENQPIRSVGADWNR
jgi:hypothetical protein